MAGAGAVRGGPGWRRTAIIAGSALAHLLVLLAVGFMVPRPVFRTIAQTPTLQLRLIAQLRRPLEPSAPSRPANSTEPLQAHVPPQTTAATPSPIVAGAPKTSPAPAADNGAIHFYESGPRDCAREDLMLLSPEERIRCAPKLQTADGTGGRPIPRDRAPLSGIDPRKREYFDAAQQRYQMLNHPEYGFTPGPGTLGPDGRSRSTLVGSMIGPGIGCGMKFGPGANKKDRRSMSDRIKQDGLASIDLGPLKCGVSIPTGSMTPEVGIAKTP